MEADLGQNQNLGCRLAGSTVSVCLVLVGPGEPPLASWQVDAYPGTLGSPIDSWQTLVFPVSVNIPPESVPGQPRCPPPPGQSHTHPTFQLSLRWLCSASF